MEYRKEKRAKYLSEMEIKNKNGGFLLCCLVKEKEKRNENI